MKKMNNFLISEEIDLNDINWNKENIQKDDDAIVVSNANYYWEDKQHNKFVEEKKALEKYFEKDKRFFKCVKSKSNRERLLKQIAIDKEEEKKKREEEKRKQEEEDRKKVKHNGLENMYLDKLNEMKSKEREFRTQEINMNQGFSVFDRIHPQITYIVSLYFFFYYKKEFKIEELIVFLGVFDHVKGLLNFVPHL
jgi:hypothetical protein